MNRSWFFPVLLIWAGLCASVMGAGFHFWPELGVGLILFFAGLTWITVRIAR